MVFKTFNSNIDTWTTKIGIFGKSFNELSTAINNSFDSVINNLDHFDEDIGFWESLNNNLAPKNEKGESWIKNNLGEIISPENIDSYIAELDLNSANEKLQEILMWDANINNNEKTWRDYFDTFYDGEQYIIDTIKKTEDLSKLTGDDLIKANQAARKSALDHNAALQQQTLGAKATSAALKTLSIAGSMIAMFAISEAISFAYKAIDNYIHRIDNLKEATNEAKSEIDSIKSDFSTLSSTTDEVKEKFAELAQGVENLGKANQSHGTLSVDDYGEFLDLSNQLAELFPQLTRGYDENGNAILGLSGNVDTIVSSLDSLVSVQQKLANQQILENMSDVWAGYTVELDEYKKELGNAEAQVNSYQAALDKLSAGGDGKITVTDSAIHQSLLAAAKKIGLDEGKWYQDNLSAFYNETWDYSGAGAGASEFKSAEWDFSSLTDVQITQLKNALGELGSEYEDAVELAKIKIASANSDMISYIGTWLSGEWNYAQMSPDMQNIARDALFNTDWVSQLPDDVDASSWDDVSNWLQENFLFAINNIDDTEIQTALSNAFNGIFTVESLQAVIDQLLGTEGFDENNPLIIYLQTKVQEKQDKAETVKSKLDTELSDDKLTQKIYELSPEDLEIAAEINVSEGSLLSWDELTAKIEEAKKAASDTSMTISTGFTDEQSQAIDAFQSKVQTLGNALSALRSGEDIGLTDLIQEFPELAGQSDNLEQAIINLIHNALAELYDLLGEGIPTEVKEDLQALADAATGTVPALSDAFSAFQKSYDAMHEFKDAMDSDGLTDSILSSVGSLSTKLNEMVAGFYAGAVSADQLYQALADHYNTDLQNYANALLAKNQYSEAFYNSIGLASTEVVNQFLHDYGIDLSNCRTYNEAKLEIERQTLQKISSIWSQYYRVQYDAATGTGDAAYDALVESASHGDAVAIAQLAAIQQQADKYSEAADALGQLANDGISANYKGITSTYKGTPVTGDKSSSEAAKTSIDWISRKLERLQKKIDLTKSKFENLFTVKSKSNNLNTQIEQTTNLLTAAQEAADKYKGLAEGIVLSEDEAQNKALKKKVRKGAYSISDYDSATAEKINQYKEYYDSYKEQLQQVEELKASIRELEIQIYQTRSDYQQSRIDKLEAQIAVTTSTKKKNVLENERIKALKRQYELEIKIAKAGGDTIKAKQLELELEAKINASKKTKFDNVVAKYENREARKQYNIEDIENAIAVTEAKGSIVNADYYRQEYEKQQALYEMYLEEEAALKSRLGTLTKYSDEWYDALGTIQDVQNKSSETVVTMESLADKVNEVASALDDLIVNKFEGLTSEADTLLSLLGDDLVDDEIGSFTKNGIAALGLYISQMELAKSAGEQLNKQLAILEQQKKSYQDGATITFIDANGNQRTISSLQELNDEIEHTRSATQEQIKSEYSYYQQIVDIVKQRYEAEQTYIDDLISRKKELLDAEQDLHAYAREIREQTDNISSLQKQLAALSSDNSLEGQARRQQLEARLEESKDSLAETEYDRLISDQKEMLDNLSDELAELTESCTKDEDALFREGLAIAKENSALVSDTIHSLAAQWNVNLSDEMHSVVGNISAVDTTLGAIRSDLQAYFAAMQTASDTSGALHRAPISNPGTARGTGAFTSEYPARNHPDTENLSDRASVIINTAMAANFDYARSSISHTPIRTGSAVMSVGDVTFSFPKDYDYQTFMRQAQADPNFEHMIGSFIKTELSGGNRLSKFSSRF